MRNLYAADLLLCECIIFFCIFRTLTSRRHYSAQVRNFLLALLPPLVGNIIIISSQNQLLCETGYYLYLIGTDWLFYFILLFCFAYTKSDFLTPRRRLVLLAVTGADTLSILLNTVFHHVFSVVPEIITNPVPFLSRRLIPLLRSSPRLPEKILYYKLESHAGHYAHLAFSYLLFAVFLLVLLVKFFRTAKIYAEKYAVMILSIVITAAWESYYIFAKIPIDLSLIGYSVCGILLYFFAIDYRPYFGLWHMMNKVSSELSDAILFFDGEGNCAYANQTTWVMLAVTENDKPEIDRIINELTFSSSLVGREDFSGKGQLSQDNWQRSYRYEYRNVLNKRGRFIGSYLRISDFTEEEAENARKLHDLHHDNLTGLYNRGYFVEKVQEFIKKDPFGSYYILVSDIRDFKLINDIYGRDTGDALLNQVADTLRTYCSKESVYGRLSSDKFALFARQGKYDLSFFEDKARKAFSLQKDMRYPVIVHLGVYNIPDIDLNIEGMIDRAFIAIKSIENDYNRCIAVYDEKLREEKIWEQKIGGMLDTAIETGQILPYLQPQINTEGEIESAEVLVRWNHPELGLLPPKKFVPFFEKSGLIVKVDLCMWEAGCKILSKWKKEGRKPICLSVNISPKDFFFIDIYGELMRLTKEYDVSPHDLHLEITESAIIKDFDATMNTLHALRKEGFIIEIDDFGSGYSSLNMLKDVPLDVLKIDMVFLQEAKETEKSNKILDSIIKMAWKLDLPTITEGVETKEQLDMLIKMGGKLFQGYYFSEPIPLDKFEEKYL